MTATLAIGLNILVVAAVVAALLNAGRLLGPASRPEGDAHLPYETGMRPFAPAVGRMAVNYVRYAVLFVVFDVDLALLLPWAVGRSGADAQRLVAVTVFAAIILFMLAYFWSKDALEC